MLLNEIDVIETRKQYALTEESILRFLDSFFNEENISKSFLLDSLIENIYIYDDKVVISMYYDDDKREININKMLETIDSRNKVIRFFLVRGSYASCFAPLFVVSVVSSTTLTQ